MISIEQWRAAIGSFVYRSPTTLSHRRQHVYVHHVTSALLIALMILLWNTGPAIGEIILIVINISRTSMTEAASAKFMASIFCDSCYLLKKKSIISGEEMCNKRNNDLTPSGTNTVYI